MIVEKRLEVIKADEVLVNVNRPGFRGGWLVYIITLQVPRAKGPEVIKAL